MKKVLKHKILQIDFSIELFSNTIYIVSLCRAETVPCEVSNPAIEFEGICIYHKISGITFLAMSLKMQKMTYTSTSPQVRSPGRKPAPLFDLPEFFFSARESAPHLHPRI